VSAAKKNLPAPDPAIEAAAAEWLVRRDRGLTPAQQDAFHQWLAARPAHRAAFERHRRLWRDFDALAQWRPEHAAEPNPDLLARPRRRRLGRWLAPLGLAAAAALALAVGRPRAPAVAAPAVIEAAGYRQERLPDGSTLDLNRGAHVVVQFAPAERRVLLVAGEAQFTVAKDAARPFIVRAGGVEVRAVGTAFHVRLDAAAARIDVLVTEGRVALAQMERVEPGAPGAIHPASPEPVRWGQRAPPTELAAGERATIPLAPAAEPVIAAATPLEIAERLDWKPRLLDFDATPLVEVVAAFNRRNPAAPRLVVGDPALAALPVVGSIRSDNTEGFVRLLEATMGVRAERPAPGEIVLRRAP
jgi:transmembrane sensor